MSCGVARGPGWKQGFPPAGAELGGHDEGSQAAVTGSQAAAEMLQPGRSSRPGLRGQGGLPGHRNLGGGHGKQTPQQDRSRGQRGARSTAPRLGGGGPGLGVSRAPGGRPFPPRPRPRVAFLPASRPRPNVPLRQDAGRGFRTSSRLKLFAEPRLARGYAPGRGWGRGAGVSVAISGGRNSSHRRGLSPRSGRHRRLVHWPTPPEAGSRAWGWGDSKGPPNLGESP